MTVRRRERGGRKPKDSDDYEVGYGKPPRAHQFKKGQSGNPKGRPKGSRNFDTILEAKLGEQMFYTRNGQEVTESRLEVLAERIVTDALKGKIGAVKAVLEQIRSIATRSTSETRNKLSLEEIDENDRAILQQAISLGLFDTKEKEG